MMNVKPESQLEQNDYSTRKLALELDSIAAIWDHMRNRAESGDTIRAEDYLKYSVSTVDTIDVIYAEYVLRTEQGQPHCQQELLERFPEYADALRRQFAMDVALSSVDFSMEATCRTDIAVAVDKSEVPTHIGKYMVVSHLSTGGQAEVFRAVHPELNREVVIKLASPKSRDESSEQRILAEGKILADLDHPNLGRVFDVGFHHGQPYLVSRYVRGRTLDEFAKQESISPQEIALLLAQITRGLGSAHRRGIIHLDIKPKNIVIDEQRNPCLIDFGLGLTRDAFNQVELENGGLRGTLPFMAPEQATGDANQLGPCCDIFGLGAVLYYLCVGEAPYATDHFAKLLVRVERGEWRRELLAEKSVAAPLRTIIEKTLDVDPKQRYRNCEEFAEVLEGFARNKHSVRRSVIITLVLFAVASLVWGWSRGWVWNSIPNAETAPIIPPAMSIEVFHSGRYVDLAESVPLTSGDLLRIFSSIPPEFHASLFLLDSEGKLRELLHLAPAIESRALRYPDQTGQAVPVIGPGGTDIVFLCLCRNNPMSESEFRDHCGLPEPVPFLPEITVLTADMQGVYVMQSGRNFGVPEDLPDPEEVVKLRLERIRRALSGKVEYLQAIAFYHAD